MEDDEDEGHLREGRGDLSADEGSRMQYVSALIPSISADQSRILAILPMREMLSAVLSGRGASARERIMLPA
jgi:hypothetical protein